LVSIFSTRTFTAAVVSQLCIAQLAGAQQTSPPPTTSEAAPPAAVPPLTTSEAAPPAAVGQPEQPDEVAAGAQTPKRKTAEEEILVTGTRVRRKDLTTPAPITVISRKEMEASGRVSIGDFLQTLPEQGNAINTSINNGGNGATRVSLRGLGAERTLVLLNGRRFVPGGNGANSSVDLNSIPSAVIERVEILKDGASAIYGSDAIAGVINLITRKRFNGAEATGYLGTSGHGDGKIYDFSATAGTAGERGSLMFSASYYQQTAAWSGDRDFSKIPKAFDGSGRGPLGMIGPYSQGSGTIPEGTISLNNNSQRGRPLPVPPPSDPNYQRVLFYNRLMAAYPTTTTFVWDATAADKGLTSVCLNPGQCWRPYRGSLLADQNGDGYNFSPDNYLVTPQQRISLYAVGETKASRFVRGYFEGAYVNRQSSQKLAAEPLGLAGENVTVSRLNFYNPFGRDFSAGPGTTALNAGGVSKRLNEFGNRVFVQDIDSFRVVIGLDGTLPQEAPGVLKGWFWDLSLNYGRTVAANVKQGNLFIPALRDAVGPSWVDADGVPHCGTSQATNITGCVPLNLFGGPNSITPDQITGLTYTGVSRGVNQMTAFQFNTSGELFRLLSDRPVGIAVGYEYRILSGENIPDPITVQGNTTGNKGDVTRGHYYVNEGYGELSLPLVSGMPFFRELEATAAARVFKYSNFGSDITYKVGGRWSVIPDFTVRGTYSTGFRAPAISELFQGQSDSFPNRQDPCRGPGVQGGGPVPANCLAQGIPPAGTGDTATQLRSRIGGNPDLKPETAKIYTAGVVFEPGFVRNLTITADYYNITIDKTITTIGTATILSGCYPTDPSVTPRYCDLISRDPNSLRIVNIINTNTNVGQDATDGIDISLNYILPTEYGRFGFLFDGTWLHKYNRTLADGTILKGKGTFDLGTTGGVYPSIKFNTGLRYGIGGLSAGVNMRFIGSFNECGTTSGQFAGSGLCYVDSTYRRRVKHYDIYDVFVSYSLESMFGKTQLALGVNNLFDKPPAVIYNGFTAATDPTAYDLLGRFFYGRLTQTF